MNQNEQATTNVTQSLETVETSKSYFDGGYTDLESYLIMNEV
jgi:hypothetical protein